MSIPTVLRGQCVDLLADCYVTEESFEQMITLTMPGLKEDLVSGKPLKTIIYGVVEAANGKGILLELVLSAAKDRPNRPELIALANAMANPNASLDFPSGVTPARRQRRRLMDFALQAIPLAGPVIPTRQQRWRLTVPVAITAILTGLIVGGSAWGIFSWLVRVPVAPPIGEPVDVPLIPIKGIFSENDCQLADDWRLNDGSAVLCVRIGPFTSPRSIPWKIALSSCVSVTPGQLPEAFLESWGTDGAVGKRSKITVSEANEQDSWIVEPVGYELHDFVYVFFRFPPSPEGAADIFRDKCRFNVLRVKVTQ